MGTLIRKELRGLLPFFVLVTFFFVTDLFDELYTEIPFLRPIAVVHRENVENSSAGTLLFLIFSLALTYGLLVRERDDGTQEFLDSMPVSRTSVFIAKVTAVVMVLGVIEAFDFATILMLQYWSRTSLDSDLHLSFLSARALLNLGQWWFFMSLGLVLSFFRRFGWLVAGLLIWAYWLLRQIAPDVEVLNALVLNEANMSGLRLTVPWRLLIVQGVLSCVLMAVSYSLYLGAGDRMLRILKNLDQSRWGSAVLLFSSFGIVIVAGSLVFLDYGVFRDAGDEDERFTSATFRSWSTSRSSTEHFRFIYPTNLAARIQPLVEAADGIHTRVCEFFQVPAGSPIEVDATGGLPSHLAGFAVWDKVRLDVATASGQSSYASVLAHETAHVLLERLSNLRLTEKYNSTRFFHEGVASYVEYHLFESRQPVDVLHAAAAVMQSRKLVDFDEIVDDVRFSARHDYELAYPLGLVFVESLVERNGQLAVAKLAGAMDRKGAPRDLEGLDLWRDTFQSCGYNLDDVLQAFFARLDVEVERRREWIESIPRPRAVLNIGAPWVEFKVLLEESDDWSATCRFRQSEHTSQLEFIAGYLNDDNICQLERSQFPAGVLWYQVGVSNHDGITLYEPWRSATISSQ